MRSSHGVLYIQKFNGNLSQLKNKNPLSSSLPSSSYYKKSVIKYVGYHFIISDSQITKNCNAWYNSVAKCNKTLSDNIDVSGSQEMLSKLNPVSTNGKHHNESLPRESPINNYW